MSAPIRLSGAEPVDELAFTGGVIGLAKYPDTLTSGAAVRAVLESGSSLPTSSSTLSGSVGLAGLRARDENVGKDAVGEDAHAAEAFVLTEVADELFAFEFPEDEMAVHHPHQSPEKSPNADLTVEGDDAPSAKS